VPEEDSSSPSANLRIDSIEPQDSSAERWKLRLSDGSSFLVSSEVLNLAGVDSLELVPGLEIERTTAHRLYESSRAVEAREKAVELLARRPHCAQELRRKLVQRNFEPETVERALGWLDGRGYLDDAGFAREWVRQRLQRHPEGRVALIAGLRRRGVAREIAEEVAAELCSGKNERASAEAALAKLSRRGGSADELRRALQRRGFASFLILELLRARRTTDPARGGGADGSG
jgi:regulatory protein